MQAINDDCILGKERTHTNVIIYLFPRNRRVSPIYHIFRTLFLLFTSLCVCFVVFFYLLNSTFISLSDSLLNRLQKHFKNTHCFFFSLLIYSYYYLSCVCVGSETHIFSSLFAHRQKVGNEFSSSAFVATVYV